MAPWIQEETWDHLHRSHLTHRASFDYDPDATAEFSATLLKVLLALEPRAVMAVMHTTTIRASMTAYSTAVGPSSWLRKFTTACFRLCMDLPPCGWRAASKGPTSLPSPPVNGAGPGLGKRWDLASRKCPAWSEVVHPFGNLATPACGVGPWL